MLEKTAQPPGAQLLQRWVSGSPTQYVPWASTTASQGGRESAVGCRERIRWTSGVAENSSMIKSCSLTHKNFSCTFPKEKRLTRILKALFPDRMNFFKKKSDVSCAASARGNFSGCWIAPPDSPLQFWGLIPQLPRLLATLSLQLSPSLGIVLG